VVTLGGRSGFLGELFGDDLRQLLRALRDLPPVLRQELAGHGEVAPADVDLDARFHERARESRPDPDLDALPARGDLAVTVQVFQEPPSPRVDSPAAETVVEINPDKLLFAANDPANI
jgi:hypothetical protein